MMLSIGHPLFEHPLVDGAGTESRRFDQRLEDSRSGGRQRQAVDRSVHAGVRIRCPASVVPVERDRISGRQRQRFGLGRQLAEYPLLKSFVPLRDPAQGPRHDPPKPSIDVAESCLSGFESDISGQYRAVDLTANAPYDTVPDFAVGADHDVASRSPHHLYQGSGNDSRPDSAHMTVNGPHADCNPRPQSQPCGPFGA